MICKNGPRHDHDTVAESRACWLSPRPAPATKPVTAGLYVLDGIFYSVRRVGPLTLLRPHRIEDNGSHVQDSMMVLALIAKRGRPATAAEAVEIGKRTRVCAMCGTRIWTPESVERGIGPVCATKV